MDAVLRAILYARVSTDEQADKGYSLPSQLEACRRYAEQHGFTVVAEFQDDCTGAIPIAERPEGKKAHALLIHGQADVLVAYTIDRLVRPPEEGDEVLLLSLVHSLNKTGKQIHTADRGQLKMDFVSLMTVMLEANRVGEERRKVVERTARGRNVKAQIGRVVGSNRPPYGYRFIRDQNNKVVGLEVFEGEAKVVRLIFQWYLDGRTMLGIAKQLEEKMHLPTPGELHGYLNRGERRDPDGKVIHHGARGVWHHTSVKDILKNETYAGTWHYGVHTVKVPALIDRPTWEAVQALRVQNKRLSKRGSKHDYLLRGLLRCGCNRGMTGAVDGGGRRRYRCTGHFYVKRDCTEPSITASAMEEKIWNDVKEIFSDLRQLKRELQIAQKEELESLAPKRDELQAVESYIRATEREADEIATVLPKAKGRVLESLERQQDEVNARYDGLVKRRAELLSDLANWRLTNSVVENILTYAADVRTGFENANPEDKRQMLEALAVNLTVEKGRYKGRCILGEWEGIVPKRSVTEGDTLSNTGRRFAGFHWRCSSRR